LINAGVYVLSPKIFEYIPENCKVSIEREVFPKLAKEGRLYGYVFDSLWIDIGEPKDYLEINKNLLDSFIKPQKYNFKQKVKVNKPVAFDKGVSIGEKSIIGPYAVLGKDVSIGNGVQIRDSIIFPETVISDFASINGAIIGEGAIIGKRVKISRECILGDYVKIKDNMSLASGVSICPSKETSESVLTSTRII
jgi:NDP-sugar pyrophosphorylase family protein